MDSEEYIEELRQKRKKRIEQFDCGEGKPIDNDEIWAEVEPRCAEEQRKK